MLCDVAGEKLSVVGDDRGSPVVRAAVTDMLTLCNVTGWDTMVSNVSK